MFIKGERIFLRALEPNDADLLYKWENNQALWPVSFTQIPFSKFILEDFVNASHQDIYTNKQLRLMIGLTDGTTIGTIDLFEFDPQHNRCGLGVFVSEDFRKNGYANECIELLKQYAFSTLHLKQLYVDINEDNTASLALFENCGFEKSGLKKAWNKKGINEYENVWMLQLLNPADNS